MTDIERQLLLALQQSTTKRASLAARAHVHRVVLSRHENGHHKGMDVTTAVRIAHSLRLKLALVPEDE